jgi:hypothetical protein
LAQHFVQGIEVRAEAGEEIVTATLGEPAIDSTPHGGRDDL